MHLFATTEEIDARRPSALGVTTIVMQHIKRGELCGCDAFLDICENTLKIIKKTVRICDPYSNVKFECFDQC